MPLDLREGGDHLDRVFIDRVVMIIVELHHRHDRLEFGQEGRQHAKLVHPPKRAFRVAVLQQQVKEDARRLAILAHLVVDQIEIGRDSPHRIGVDQVAGPQRLFEDPQQVQLVGEERLFIGNGDPSVLDHIARAQLLASPQ